MHQSSLKLKLRILRLGKLVSHNAAMCHQTSRQLSQALVLARASSQTVWNQAQWEIWCNLLEGEGRVQKATLPVEQQRAAERAAVRASVRKRPSSGGAHKTKKRRTPTTLQRKDSLRRGGVRVLPSSN